MNSHFLMTADDSVRDAPGEVAATTAGRRSAAETAARNFILVLIYY